jgi:hypothetical protein
MKTNFVQRLVYIFHKTKSTHVVKTGKLLKFKEGVDIFNVKRKWWLSYSFDRNTGSFRTKREAIAWYEKGGR